MSATAPRMQFRATPPADVSVRPALVLALVVTCQLMIVLDATVVNIALPPIQADPGFSATGLSWVVNAYTLAFGGLLLLGGRLGDAFGVDPATGRSACSPRCPPQAERSACSSAAP